MPDDLSDDWGDLCRWALAEKLVYYDDELVFDIDG